MKKQLELLDEVIDNFTEEEKQIMEDNRFPYIFSKAWMYLKKGPEIYRKHDAFQQPPSDFDDEELQILTDGCNQILRGVGMTENNPFTNLDVFGFYNLFRLFHFDYIDRKTNHYFTLNGKQGILDCITFQHYVDDSQVVYYNFCEYSEKKEIKIHKI
ncbi:hypothetical protein [Flavobacterium aciduliphilum]|uniref:Uncharacterized protein n=1 Tax=Flavobacterium aciduliphilum TaxID=1101402 RepID=A0A328YNJ3_9FLAO|nr:hypothetical protein [Flavobacterium aciduliphilum]RAR73722.1 hypothetical protein CLV55_10341 [Flavobacterium aciduliphilum]